MNTIIDTKVRFNVSIEGVVQGVGFRPFVYQQAMVLSLTGWVLNTTSGVVLEVEGDRETVSILLDLIKNSPPPLASISSWTEKEILLEGSTEFSIRQSGEDTVAKAQITPDNHVCDDCYNELFDTNDRRYQYPFINCTNCGPRFTIITGTPYDRPKTTMVDFPMCDSCAAEYADPQSRRFHAQPNACPDCGPQVALLDSDCNPVAGDPIVRTIEMLQAGKIVAVKGLGGYHLVVDAKNSEAVELLRQRKSRDEKPFAVMCLSLDEAESLVEIDMTERRLLQSVERPIILLRKKKKLLKNSSLLSGSVAPGNSFLGVMLPYTPLHYLLLNELGTLVMTSANVSDEPILYRDSEAYDRLKGIADAYLTHNRSIHMRTDDSIMRVMSNKPVLLRRSRGFVPRCLFLDFKSPPILALGGDIKNLFCLADGDRVYLSQHIGDLKNRAVIDSLEQSIDHFVTLTGIEPEIVAHDKHPDYYSSNFAIEHFPQTKLVAVQHHHAHMASCMAEHRIGDDGGEVIGIIFDGLGYGDDGTMWGGEFLVGGFSGYRRAAHLSPLAMPGGDIATREPWRMAIAALVSAYGDDIPWPDTLTHLTEIEERLTVQMVQKGINSPLTSSCGRLFDAVASLIGVRQMVSYEGQAALELEMAIDDDGGGEVDGQPDDIYPFTLREEEGSATVLDTSAMIMAIVDDCKAGMSAAVISRKFHLTIVDMVVAVSVHLRTMHGLDRVVLSGGVFQNKFLTEHVRTSLEEEHFSVYTHSLVPPNDGGIALGQAAIAGFTKIRQ